MKKEKIFNDLNNVPLDSVERRNLDIQRAGEQTAILNAILTKLQAIEKLLEKLGQK